MEKEINAPLFAPWKEGKGHEKTEDAAIGRLPSAARPKGCPFPNSLITAKKHDPESYTLSPFGGEKKKAQSSNVSESKIFACVFERGFQKRSINLRTQRYGPRI